jgi:hypothetical protein
MPLTLDQVVEKYPYLNKRWIKENANAGIIPHSRPHYRLYMFDEVEFEKAIMAMKPGTVDLDKEVAREHLTTRKNKRKKKVS